MNAYGTNVSCPQCGFMPTMGGMGMPQMGAWGANIACPQCGYAPTMGAMGMPWGYGQGMMPGGPGMMPGYGPRFQGYGMPFGGFPGGFAPYGPGFMAGGIGYGPGMGFGPGMGYGPWAMGGMMPGMGGYTYPTFATTGAPSDEQIREMVYDSIDADPAVPYDADINVDVTGGVVTLTGTVPSKRVKHSVGDDAWWVPGVWDINNNIQVAGRRAAGREQPEAKPAPAPHPQARSRQARSKQGSSQTASS